VVWSEGAADSEAFGLPIQAARRQPTGSFQTVQAVTVTPLEFAGLTVTEDHYLVAGVSGPAGQEGYLVF